MADGGCSLRANACNRSFLLAVRQGPSNHSHRSGQPAGALALSGEAWQAYLASELARHPVDWEGFYKALRGAALLLGIVVLVAFWVVLRSGFTHWPLFLPLCQLDAAGCAECR